MSEFFSASEIFQFAIRIEENGEKFYRLLAASLKDDAIKKAFTYLADEEVRHRRTFQEMVSKIESYQPKESYGDEYFAFLRAYADEHIFTPQKSAQVAAKKIKSAKEAIEFALALEIDSILYYLEAKKLVPEPEREAMDKIVDEERRHYLKLSEFRKKP